MQKYSNVEIKGTDYDLDELHPIAIDVPPPVEHRDDELDIPPSEKKLHHSSDNTSAPNYSFYGKLTELYFQLQAYERGLDVYQPTRPDSPTDFIVDNGKKLIKIQCKSVFGPRRDSYQIGLFGSGNKGYAAKDVHFFACYIFATSQFFIVPFEAVADKSWLFINPSNPQKQYLENWQALADAS